MVKSVSISWRADDLDDDDLVDDDDLSVCFEDGVALTASVLGLT